MPKSTLNLVASAKDEMAPASERGTNLAIVLATLFLLTPLYLFSERITIGDGFGVDGQAYGLWAQEFVEQVVHKKLHPYYVQRVLPSAVVAGVLGLLGCAPTNRHVITGFVLLNLAMLAVCAWGWCQVADELSISRRGKWLGAAALFVNAAVMKCYAYYPVLTDLTAYALGMLMLLCYLRGRSWSLYLLTLIGAFTWPTMVYCGAAMLLFPRRVVAQEPHASPTLRGLIAGASTFVILASATLLREFDYPDFLGHPGGMPVEPLMPLSLAVVALHWLFGSYFLFDGGMLRSWRPWLRTASLTRCAAVVSLVGLRWLQTNMLSNRETGLGVMYRLGFTVFTSICKPAIFLVAHAVYYGPLILLALFLWKPVCRLLRRDGVGLTLCLCFLFAQSLCSESRGAINLYPILVAYTVKVTDLLPWRLSDYLGIGLISLAMSKVWLVINTGPFGTNPLEFPRQKMMMNYGPWMSTGMWIVQGGAVVLCALIFYLSLPLRVPTLSAAPLEGTSR